MESTEQKKIIKTVRNEPTLAEVFKVPILSVPTSLLFVVFYVGFGATTYLYFQGAINWPLVIVANTIFIYISFTPFHEATHRSWSRVNWVNETLGTMSAQLLLPGFNTSLYRYLHVATHHQHTGEADADPDVLFLTGSVLPRVARWAFLDILWVRAYVGAWSTRPVAERVRFSVGVLVYVSVLVIGSMSSFVNEFLVAFVVPCLLARITIVYFFAYIHHPHGVEQRVNPVGATGIIETATVNHWLMLGQTRHLIHHLYPGLPWYRYEPVWNVLRGKIPESLVRWGGFGGRSWLNRGEQL